MGKTAVTKTGMSAPEKAFHLVMSYATLGLWYLFVYLPRRHHLDRVTKTKIRA